jgi:hypothetical protein
VTVQWSSQRQNALEYQPEYAANGSELRILEEENGQQNREPSVATRRESNDLGSQMSPLPLGNDENASEDDTLALRFTHRDTESRIEGDGTARTASSSMSAHRMPPTSVGNDEDASGDGTPAMNLTHRNTEPLTEDDGTALTVSSSVPPRQMPRESMQEQDLQLSPDVRRRITWDT